MIVDLGEAVGAEDEGELRRVEERRGLGQRAPPAPGARAAAARRGPAGRRRAGRGGARAGGGPRCRGPWPRPRSSSPVGSPASDVRAAEPRGRDAARAAAGGGARAAGPVGERGGARGRRSRGRRPARRSNGGRARGCRRPGRARAGRRAPPWRRRRGRASSRPAPSPAPAPQTTSQDLARVSADVEQPPVLGADQLAAGVLGRRRTPAARARRVDRQTGWPSARRRICGGLRAVLARRAVSGRMTIGASRPLAPCTVITRTWSAPSSLRRFTATSSRSNQSRSR